VSHHRGVKIGVVLAAIASSVLPASLDCSYLWKVDVTPLQMKHDITAAAVPIIAIHAITMPAMPPVESDPVKKQHQDFKEKL
jgi:hypothetical protein